MADLQKKKKKKIPKSIIVIGTLQTALGLWSIFSMATSGKWDIYIALLAFFYSLLGAGLLAIMEWARFANVIVHIMLIPYILANAMYGDRAGLGSAIWIMITAATAYILTRPHIRALFRREPFPYPNQNVTTQPLDIDL